MFGGVIWGRLLSQLRTSCSSRGVGAGGGRGVDLRILTRERPFLAGGCCSSSWLLPACLLCPGAPCLQSHRGYVASSRSCLGSWERRLRIPPGSLLGACLCPLPSAVAINVLPPELAEEQKVLLSNSKMLPSSQGWRSRSLSNCLVTLHSGGCITVGLTSTNFLSACFINY